MQCYHLILVVAHDKIWCPHLLQTLKMPPKRLWRWEMMSKLNVLSTKLIYEGSNFILHLVSKWQEYFLVTEQILSDLHMTCTGPIWGTTLVSKYFWWNLHNREKFHQNLTNHSVLIKNTLREKEVVPFVLLESQSTLDKISRSRNGIEVKLLPQCLQTTDGDWWCQYLCKVTGVYLIDWKT